jgi:hypothetical protein
MANSSNQIFVKLDPSCKAKPYFFSDGVNCLSKNYTLKQADAHYELLESLGYEVINCTS